MTQFKRLIGILTCAAALWWPTTFTAMAAQAAVADEQASQAWTTIDEDWMVVEIGGGKVGWMSTIVEQAGDQFRTSSKTKMKMGRGPTAVEIAMDAVFVEKEDGEPVSVQFVQKMAMQAIDTTWVFEGDKVKQTSVVGGRTTTKEHDRPEGDWMMPQVAEKFVEQQQSAGVEKFSYKTLNPESGLKPITITSTREGEKEFEIDGKKQKVTVWKSVTDLMPVVATEYYDESGDMVYQELPTGLGQILMRRATKAQALDEADGEVPEILVKTFITPDKPIDKPMKAKRATFKLIAKEGELPELPSAGAQRVEMADDRMSALVVIDIENNLAASEADTSNGEYTSASSMVDYEDALVTKISEAAQDEHSDMNKTLRLRKVAHDRISKKGMATAFACASETARTKTGDCSEHGVLLCALLRAQGIPSRLAMGLIYVDEFMGADDIFGWHMWTQALIDGKWVDLDATLPVPYHAAHVLTNVSSMSDGLGTADMASMLQLIGNVDIEVMEVEYD